MILFLMNKILPISVYKRHLVRKKQYSAQIKTNYNPYVIQNLSRQYDAFAIQLNEISDK